MKTINMNENISFLKKEVESRDKTISELQIKYTKLNSDIIA